MKINSPYSASFTGGGFLLEETKILLPLMLSEDAEKQLKEEALNNNLLLINAETSRKRIISEVKLRFSKFPRTFWENFLDKNEIAQRLDIFYVLLKTYKLIFDLHLNVAMKKWSSINHQIDLSDVLLELKEIAANDEFVDSWSEQTHKKICSSYLTILKRVGLVDDFGNLQSLDMPDDIVINYLKSGETWFIDFCLIPPYEVERIKASLV